MAIVMHKGESEANVDKGQVELLQKAGWKFGKAKAKPEAKPATKPASKAE